MLKMKSLLGDECLNMELQMQHNYVTGSVFRIVSLVSCYDEILSFQPWPLPWIPEIIIFGVFLKQNLLVKHPLTANNGEALL